MPLIRGFEAFEDDNESPIAEVGEGEAVSGDLVEAGSDVGSDVGSDAGFEAGSEADYGADTSVYAVESAELVLAGEDDASLADAKAASARRRAHAQVAGNILLNSKPGVDKAALVAQRLAITLDEANELLGSADVADYARAQASLVALTLADRAARHWVGAMDTLEAIEGDDEVDSGVRTKAATARAAEARGMVALVSRGGPSEGGGSNQTVVVQSAFTLPALPSLPAGGFGLKKQN